MTIKEKVLDGLSLAAHLLFGWMLLGFGFWLALNVLATVFFSK